MKILIIAGASFAIVKLVFRFLGWFTKDDLPKVSVESHLREKCNEAWDVLHENTILELTKRILCRLVSRISDWFGRREKAKSLITVLLVVCLVNFLSLGLACYAMYALDTVDKINLIGLVAISFSDLSEEEIEKLKLSDFLARYLSTLMLLMSSLLVATLLADVLSAAITWILLKRAARSKSGRALIGLVLVDFLVLLSIFAWVTSFTRGTADYFILGNSHLFSTSYGEHLLGRLVDLPNELFVRDLIPYLLMTLSSSIPTIAYLSIIIPAGIIHFAPEASKDILITLVLRIGGGKKPVLAHLGDFCGGLAAAIAAAVLIAKQLVGG